MKDVPRTSTAHMTSLYEGRTSYIYSGQELSMKDIPCTAQQKRNVAQHMHLSNSNRQTIPKLKLEIKKNFSVEDDA